MLTIAEELGSAQLGAVQVIGGTTKRRGRVLLNRGGQRRQRRIQILMVFSFLSKITKLFETFFLSSSKLAFAGAARNVVIRQVKKARRGKLETEDSFIVGIFRIQM